MPVRPSSSRSGSTLVKWAATPSSAPIPIAHQVAAAESGRERVTIDGSSPKLTTYGTTENAVLFRPRLYAQAEARKTTFAIVTHGPRTIEVATEKIAVPTAHARTVRTGTRPRATGLSVRPTARSRSASSQSFDNPTDA